MSRRSRRHPSQHINAPAGQLKNEKRNGEANGEIASRSTDLSESDKHENKKNGLRKIASYFFKDANVIIAAGTLLLAGEGLYSLYETREALITSERAWIAPIDARLGAPLVDGQPIDVLIDFVNSGKDPALDVVNMAHGGITLPMNVQELARQLKLGPQVPSAIDSCAQATPKDGWPTVYPASVQHQAADVGHSFVADAAIMHRERIFFVDGCFGYMTMKERHYSEYCFWLSVPPPGSDGKAMFRSCIVGNKAT